VSPSKHRPDNCRDCGRNELEAGRISRTGLCGDCAIARQVQNLAGLSRQEGPAWDRWVAGMRQWVENTQR
jgi:hypothetical protein